MSNSSVDENTFQTRLDSHFLIECDALEHDVLLWKARAALFNPTVATLFEEFKLDWRFITCRQSSVMRTPRAASDDRCLPGDLQIYSSDLQRPAVSVCAHFVARSRDALGQCDFPVGYHPAKRVPLA